MKKYFIAVGLAQVRVPKRVFEEMARLFLWPLTFKTVQSSKYTNVKETHYYLHVPQK